MPLGFYIASRENPIGKAWVAGLLGCFGHRYELQVGHDRRVRRVGAGLPRSRGTIF